MYAAQLGQLRLGVLTFSEPPTIFANRRWRPSCVV